MKLSKEDWERLILVSQDQIKGCLMTATLAHNAIQLAKNELRKFPKAKNQGRKVK